MKEVLGNYQSPDGNYSLRLEHRFVTPDSGSHHVVITPNRGLFRCLRRHDVMVCASGIDFAPIVGGRSPVGFDIEGISVSTHTQFFRVQFQKVCFPNGSTAPPVRTTQFLWYDYLGREQYRGESD